MGSSLVSRTCVVQKSNLLAGLYARHKPTRRKLERVNFCKDFWDFFQGLGKNWPIADWRLKLAPPQ